MQRRRRSTRPAAVAPRAPAAPGPAARDAELEACALQVVADTRELHVREVPAFDSSRELCLDAVDLGDDVLCLCLLGSDGAGFRGRCRGDAESHCYCTEKSGYVTDS